jgi:hypothetical protein
MKARLVPGKFAIAKLIGMSYTKRKNFFICNPIPNR